MGSLHLFLLDFSVVVGELTSLGGAEGCNMSPGCPFSEELIAPATGRAVDNLQVAGPERTASSVERHWALGHAFLGGPHPRTDRCGNTKPSTTTSEQVRAFLALVLPLGPAEVRPES